MHLRSWAIVLVSMAMLAGCISTEGYIEPSVRSVPRTVNPPPEIPGDLVPYLPRIVSVVEKADFRVRPTNNPDAMELRLAFDGNPYNMTVSISLVQHGMPVVSVNSVNPGWGTWTARASAVEGRIDSALEQFEEELRVASAYLIIAGD